jgi:hypothetical protein
MLRRLIRAGVIVFLSASPGFAQSSIGIPVNPDKPPNQFEIDRRKATDQAYDAAMKKIPNKTPSADPWGNVRPTAPATSKTKQQQN